jgi:imidazolonepropionase
MTRILFTNLSAVATCVSADADAILGDGAVLVVDGAIAAVGQESALVGQVAYDERVDGRGGVLTPGFVDSHTHAVFGRWRAWEYALRSRGVPYMEIARRGGGIHASVRDVRSLGEDELVERTRPRLADMVALGTTTAEVKSGYGLDTDSELRMLRVVQRLAAEGPLDLVPTFMGAHELPAEYAGRRDEYVALLVAETIPAVAAQGLAVFCDVFMEPGVFTPEETRTILEAGLRHGLVPKVHADELENSGGAQLAAALGAASADHLGRISDEGIAAIAGSETVATLLPATLFFLGKSAFAPARKLLDAGASVALATDFNPGTAPSPSMPLVMTMACSQMGMEPVEALYAATAGGARALRLEDGRGTIRVGAPADLVLWDVEDVAEIAYRFGAPPIRGVWKRGRRVR